MKPILLFLIILSVSVLASHAVEFIPYNFDSVGAKQKQAKMELVYAALSDSDKVVVKSLEAKYKGKIQVEQNKGTPNVSSSVIEKLRQEHFKELASQLSPQALDKLVGSDLKELN